MDDVVGLRDLDLRHDYRSGYESLLEDFFRPALRESQEYWRAVGYFSSSALEAFGQPLEAFVSRGGYIKLITSVELSQRDLKAIAEGTNKRTVCAQRLTEVLDEDFAKWRTDGVWRLVRLLELGRLHIQIAVPRNGSGIYHEKVGVFFDEDTFVAFSGSVNETRNALENNRECLDVYPAWDSPARADSKRNHFEEIWSGIDDTVEVFTFPEAAQRNLLRIYEDYEPEGSRSGPREAKWKHQDEALQIFLENERGVLNMATGTGKTRTALRIIDALLERNLITTVIVSAEGNDLLHQWRREALDLLYASGHPLSQYSDFDDRKDVQEFTLSPERSLLLVSRTRGTTRDPLATALRSLPPRQQARTLLVHDEVHKLGSPGNRDRLAGLSEGIRYRLGLSATPEREYDETGNRFVEDHIGPVLMTFELADAIRRGILSPFLYHPLSYELTEDDRRRIHEVYRRKAARAAAGEPMSDEELWIELAKVHKTSPAKLPVFEQFIQKNPELLRRAIVFVETQEYGERVLDTIHRHCPDFHTYFSGETSDTLRRFATGDLECLVTCHRLSEGIDIHDLNSVILFSSARARLETIQRIGRCLRRNPSNPGKVANVVDFIRESADTDPPTPDEERRDWLSHLATIRPEE